MLLHLNHTSAGYIMLHTVPCTAPQLLVRNVCASSSKPDKACISCSLLLLTKPLGLNPGSTDMDEIFGLTLPGLRLTQNVQLGKNVVCNS